MCALKNDYIYFIFNYSNKSYKKQINIINKKLLLKFY